MILERRSILVYILCLYGVSKGSFSPFVKLLKNYLKQRKRVSRLEDQKTG
jgi:hypothetical protein